MNRPILIVGSGGQLGMELRLCCAQRKIDYITMDRNDYDFSDLTNIEKFFTQYFEKFQPGIIINASAYTAVDKAEDEYEKAYSINARVPEYFAKESHKKKIPFVHYSTDYVFDGKAKVPYQEGYPVNPIGVYGKTKFEGERLVNASNPESIIIRTSWLYGLHGNNFIKTMYRLMIEKESINVVSDQWGCPTWSLDLANITLDIILNEKKLDKAKGNTFHFCNQGEISWYEFALAIFQKLKENGIELKCKKINAILTKDYPTKAKRPKYSVMDTNKIEKLNEYSIPKWNESLDKYIKEYLFSKGIDNASIRF